MSTTGDAVEDDGDGTDRDPIEFGAATPPAEWAMAGFGLLVLAVVVGALVVVAVGGGDRPPTFHAEVVRTQDVAEDHLLLVDVTNRGTSAAAAVHVEGTAPTADGTQVATAEIDYLPAGSTVTVGLVFADAPTGTPQIGVVGFRDP